MFWLLIWLAGISAPAGAEAPVLFPGPENLLKNPGFEDLTVDQPEHWKLFALPKDGAFGRIDDDAHGDKFSVMLHTPTPYDRDPMNNWSQNIIDDFSGKQLELTGHIKVREATEAAIWVQCWRKRPWGVSRAGTTSTDTPIYGTRDWESVALTIDVPENTAFVTVRCVLKGTGTAWFDDLALKAAETAEAEPAEKEAEDQKQKEPAKEDADPDSGPPVPAEDPQLMELDLLEDDIDELRQTNELLIESLMDMYDNNQRIRTQLRALQQQLRQVQEGLPSGEPPALPPAQAPQLEPLEPRVPPLVPHGENWRMYE